MRPFKRRPFWLSCGYDGIPPPRHGFPLLLLHAQLHVSLSSPPKYSLVYPGSTRLQYTLVPSSIPQSPPHAPPRATKSSNILYPDKEHPPLLPSLLTPFPYNPARGLQPITCKRFPQTGRHPLHMPLDCCVLERGWTAGLRLQTRIPLRRQTPTANAATLITNSSN